MKQLLQQCNFMLYAPCQTLLCYFSFWHTIIRHSVLLYRVRIVKNVCYLTQWAHIMGFSLEKDSESIPKI